MAKKRKAKSERSHDSNGPNLDVGESRKRIRNFEDVADSDDEFHLNRDKVLLDEGPEAKRRRRLEEQEEFLQPSDEEVLGYVDEDEEEEDETNNVDRRQSGPRAVEPDSEASDRDDGDGEDEFAWGTGKDDIYGADEIETEEQALEEEAEAKRLQKKQLEAMTAADYGFDEADWQESGTEENESKQGQAIVTEVLPQLQIDQDMTSAEKLKLLKSRYPEFEPLSKELHIVQEQHTSLSSELESLLQEQHVERMHLPNLTTKIRAASAYLGALTMYFALLCSPASSEGANAVAMSATQLRDHPIMDTLVHCREIWQRAKALGDDVLPDSDVEEENSDDSSVDIVKPSRPREAAHSDRAMDKKSRAQRHVEAAEAAAEARRDERMKRTEADLAKLNKLVARSAKTNRSESNELDDSDAGEEAPLTAQEAAEKAKRKKSLRFYTSQIAQKANKRGTAGRNAGGDEDIPHRERLRDRQVRLNAEAEKRGRKDIDARAELGDESDEEDARQAEEIRGGANEDDDYYDLVAARTTKKKHDKAAFAEAQKQAALQGGRVVPEETVGADGKRKITYAIEKNKGLTPHRKKEVRNPRVKKRKKFDEKKKKLASIKPVYKGGEGRRGYGGELTGIKKGLVKSDACCINAALNDYMEPHCLSLGLFLQTRQGSTLMPCAEADFPATVYRNGSLLSSTLDPYSGYTVTNPANGMLPLVKLQSILVASSVMLIQAWHLYLNYRAFKSLGPGSTASTLSGYLKVTMLSLFAVRSPHRAPTRAAVSPGYLSHLPERAGERPIVKGIAPHRQVTQQATQDTYQKLVAAITHIPLCDGSLVLGTSCIERHGMALFYRSCTRQNEICHLHVRDGSMHIVAGQADVKTILEARWGERHPLAHGGWFERFVPAGFVMVYAPRDDAEVEVVRHILVAAAKCMKDLREQDLVPTQSAM